MPFYDKIKISWRSVMKKEQILAVLRSSEELSLTEIYNKILLNEYVEEDGVSKPLILHHLNNMIKEGIVLKNINKKYKIVSIDYGKGDSLNVESLDTIVLPRIIARAGPAEKYIPDNIERSSVKLNKNLYKTEDLILVEIAGNSMLPTFYDGDLLLFKKFNLGEKPTNNQIILARVGDGAKVKRFMKIGNKGLLLSDNSSDPDNGPISINDENFMPIGFYLSKIDSSN